MRPNRMTAGWMIALAAALALPACAAHQSRTDASAPTVSYAYEDSDDYDEVAEKADDYCEAEYDRDAVLVDRDDEGGDYEATFACE